MSSTPSRTTSIVALIGPQLGGKSTFADALWRDHSYERISFADPLYKMMGVILGDSKVDTLRKENRKEEPLPELGGKSLRQALQTLGTEWGRDTLYRNIWIDTLIRKAREHERVVIDDMRFPDEHAAMLREDALIIRMAPQGEAKDRSDEVEAQAATHSSESYRDEMTAHLKINWRFRSELFHDSRHFSDEVATVLKKEIPHVNPPHYSQTEYLMNPKVLEKLIPK